MHINSDSVAVITGAGGGIGESIAQWLAKLGASVVIADIDEEAAKKVAARIQQDFNTKAIAVKTDVSKLEDVEKLASAAYDRFGKVDILVNNAGVTMRPFRASWDTSYSDFQWMFGVNWWGVLHGHHVFVPRMRETSGPKHIVNTSSMATLMSIAGHSAYTASKGAVDGFSNSSREELVTQDIGVSVLYPGPVRTRIVTSERLRPAEDQSDTRGVKSWLAYSGKPTDTATAVSESGVVADPSFPGSASQYISPDETGRFVVEGILENKPYISTHPVSSELLSARVTAVLAGQPKRAA
jgi:NAD(P)-dependent dehydrogenase (short-subunit alcohol dehydrogenase family)